MKRGGGPKERPPASILDWVTSIQDVCYSGEPIGNTFWRTGGYAKAIRHCVTGFFFFGL